MNSRSMLKNSLDADSRAWASPQGRRKERSCARHEDCFYEGGCGACEPSLFDVPGTATPRRVCSGQPGSLIMPMQGRLGDNAHCPSCGHGNICCSHGVTGPGVQGSMTVHVNSMPALRMGDPGVHSSCCGANAWNAVGCSATVQINGLGAHRLGDMTQHCGGTGTLIQGSPNVIVGG